MRITEIALTIPAPRSERPLAEVRRAVLRTLPAGVVPVRLAVVASGPDSWSCEVGVVEGLDPSHVAAVQPMFDVRRREAEDAGRFTVVLVIPTGVGADIGGHAGDAMPVAALAASVADTLITHPNVVNGSDIMELPANGLYVEGSVISRLLAGTVGLRPVRANRVLPVIDRHPVRKFEAAAINSVSAARVSLGLDAPEVVVLDPRVRLASRYTESGRAVGEVSGFEGLLQLLDDRRGQYDAVALSTQVEVPFEYHVDYYEAHGAMVNPWGGPEAIFTHAISSLYDVPAAHAPMLESSEVENLQLDVVDPRMAAEMISTAYFVCVLKGLQRSPRLVRLADRVPAGVIAAEHVSALVVPDGVVGLPVLAAVEQGIPVIAVRENRTIVHNDLRRLPWRRNQLHIVENYWEAVGVLAALRLGVDPAVVRRPVADTHELIAAAAAPAAA